jgi:hypothetical protein
VSRQDIRVLGPKTGAGFRRVFAGCGSGFVQTAIEPRKLGANCRPGYLSRRHGQTATIEGNDGPDADPGADGETAHDLH